jgi:Prokaryotic lipoprotein-attachment site
MGRGVNRLAGLRQGELPLRVEANWNHALTVRKALIIQAGMKHLALLLCLALAACGAKGDLEPPPQQLAQ